MEDLGRFEVLFGSEPDVAYGQNTCEQATKNRKRLEGELFFDRSLKEAGLQEGSSLYPPKSNEDLRKLYQHIAGSASPHHYKQSLVYYILKDLDPKINNSLDYQRQSQLPRKYKVFIDGIWALDHFKFENAVKNLTDPALVPTFSQEVLYALCKHCKDNPSLPLAYYHAISPSVIDSASSLDALTDIVASASVTEAFFFSRAHDELTQRHIFERLLTFVHGDSGGSVRATRAVELIGLPFDENEETWCEEYLLLGKGKALYGAKDTVIMRRIAMGRAESAAELSINVKERKIDGLTWMSLTDGLQQPSA